MLHTDRAGCPVAGGWIERSGASPEAWVRALLDVYLVPVAHLLPVSYTHLDVYKRQEVTR